MSTSLTISEHSPPIEIDGRLWAVTFSANGEYLISGDDEMVRTWRVKDAKEMATVAAGIVDCLAVSNDDTCIAAGTSDGGVFLWNAKTYKEIFAHTSEDSRYINAVDFSPNSSRLVVASDEGTATIWNVRTRKQVQTLRHVGQVLAARYSPQGDRIATATRHAIRVWVSNNGRLLVDIPVTVTAYYNTGLAWFYNHLLVISDGTIQQFEASTGSLVAEWLVPDACGLSCIAVPKHGEFIAYSTKRSVTFWSTSTRTQFASIEYPEDVCSIALSPDDQSLAIGGVRGKVRIKSLSRNTNDRDRDPVAHPSRHSDSAALYVTPTQRLRVWAKTTLTRASWKDALASAVGPRCTVYRVVCERLEVIDRVADAVQCFNQMTSELTEAMNLPREHVEWARDFSQRSFEKLEHLGNAAVDAQRYDEAVSHYTAALSLNPSSPQDILIKRGKALVATGSWKGAVDDANQVISLDPSSRPALDFKERLLQQLKKVAGTEVSAKRYGEAISHYTTALSLNPSSPLDILIRRGEAFMEMGSWKEAVDDANRVTMLDPSSARARSFKQRSSDKLAHLGDAAVNAQRYDEAILHYTIALSLEPASPQGILIKRGKGYLAIRTWQKALDDANQAIKLDPSSPWGYEIKRTAYHEVGDYDNAIVAREEMLSKISESPDRHIQQHGDRYISPSSARAEIRGIVQKITRRLPRVLINTATGRLHDRAEHVSTFESQSIFKELVSSTATRTNYRHIKRKVREYFGYVMLSHKWEKDEPDFQMVKKTAVYNLDKSPTHDKLRTFCGIVRDRGHNWAWSDTCCINKSDHFVLQEALVAMFKWYQGSTETIVFLRGVHSSSLRGALIRSIWNTRGWTLQEYIASKVVLFYTEDWTPYLDLKLSNHKLSPEVILEMEEATRVSSEQLKGLCPGFSSIREKLRLASTRQTTLVEDAAYSLLGIFSVKGIPAIYGEGEASLGRLLAHVLAGSGDLSILAWIGESGSFNSCLPAHITVFSEAATSHVPPPISDAEMERFFTAPHASSFDLDAALALYDRLNELPAPWFAASRMKLPCIAFELPSLTPYRTRSGYVYRVDTHPFGSVEIKTRHDLSRMDTLYLVHPWLDALLEREEMPSGASVEDDFAPPLPPDSGDEELFGEDIDNEVELPTLPPLVRRTPTDRETGARQLAARLRQPFGALLVTLTALGRRAMDHRRVAADSLITVQFRDNISLSDILDNVRTIDVL